jgi:superfamily II DNA or RNA helicase
MIYLLQRYYNLPTLIIVDSTAAVQQMADDLESYGYDVNNIHMIYGGQDKTILKPVVISTWQSIAKSNADYLCKFGVIVGDEAHHFQAKTFKEFMEKATEAKYRFGFTGTIDDTESECNEMILTGLFGPVEKFITTAELMDQGYVTPLKIKSIVLQYNNNTKKTVYKIVDKRKKIDYNDEMKFIESYVKRNNFIKNLVCDLKGNTLLFFQHKEHGELLYSMIREELAKRGLPVTNVHISHGEIAGKKRNDLRGIFEKNTGQIGVVSYGTFQTSISIKNVHNMVFGSPSKSLIRVLQSIGRGLRLHESKEYVTLFDLADNLMLGNSKNHTIKHFKVRMQIYAKENFKVKIYNVKLEDE